MRLIFLGAPGVGKGTQAQRLAAEEGISTISTGEILREAIKQGTELGKQAKSYMEAGKLVPDDVVIGIMRERLSGSCRRGGFILDGFPRTLEQAEALDRMLQERGEGIDHVVNFEVPTAEIIRRLSGRRSCPACQSVFHVENAPPRDAGRCDQCGATLIQRADDTPETIAARLQVYEEQTRPVVDYYKKQGLLRQVDATASIDKVYDRLKSVVSATSRA